MCILTWQKMKKVAVVEGKSDSGEKVFSKKVAVGCV